MRVLLTGASGFIGSAILPELIQGGHEVTCLVRSDTSAKYVTDTGGEVLKGDLADLEILRRAANGSDAIIHAAFDHDFANMAKSCETDRLAIETLGEAILGSERRFIITSGLPALFGQMATENDRIPADGHGTPRRSEQAAEALIERGVRAMVVRMSQCHDQDKQGFGSYMMDHARQTGKAAYVGAGGNRWPAVHRLDAAKLYRAVLEHGNSNERYHAVAESGVTVRDVAEAIATRLSLPTVQLTKEESPSHFAWLDQVAQMDVPASSEQTQRQLGWRPLEQATLIADIENAHLN